MQALVSILENNPQAFFDKISQINSLGLQSPRVHVDIITNDFATNRTLLPEQWPELNKDFTIDVHLMTSQPQNFLDICQNKKINRVIAHLEKLDSPQQWVDMVEKRGLNAGIAIDLDTKVEDFGLPICKNKLQILLMSVKAGFSGQVFNQSVLQKITALRKIYGNKAEIIVDGGINLENAKLCKQFGADGVAVNSWLWQDLQTRYGQIKSI